MRKILLYIFAFLIICFAIPVVFTSYKGGEVSANIVEKENIIESTYDYKKYDTIKLLHSSNNKIESIPLDEYLYGVVSAEMPAKYEVEALKAQAIVARTYTLYKIVNQNKKHGEADICDNSGCCQAWISKEDRLAKWKEEERESY